MSRPKISVIMATYQWSAAVRCALRSIQSQTFEDYEVLVVGDACTDDTAEVVRSFGDPRFSFHNMARNHGSQWAPNNLGLHLAGGEWVAYCGHDDIWLPAHLASLAATMDARQASAAASGLLMYGPPGSEVVSQAALTSEPMLDDRQIVPPSALMHRRDLVFDIGWWNRADDLVLPVDHDFQFRVMKQCSIYVTGELTVLKFNAGSRRDVYKTKSVAEQERALAGIADDPEFLRKAMLSALQSFSKGKLSQLLRSDFGHLAPGEVARRNRRFKGVEPPFPSMELRRLRTAVGFTLEAIQGGHEWHDLETNGARSFRWTGPLTTSVLDLPILVESPAEIVMTLLGAADGDLNASELLRNMVFHVNAEVRSWTAAFCDDGSCQVSVQVEPLVGHLRIAIELARTCKISSADQRDLGLAVALIQIAPLPGSDDSSSNAREPV